MPILFRCPHCRKMLKVKDQLAGKKATCPLCKAKGVLIPAPAPAPAVDAAVVEALAAAALADAGPAPEVVAQAKATATIDFTCPFCDEELKLGADLGGKKEPCPKCKRIIKVPLPADNKPKDWRTVESKGPSGAVKSDQPALEGAWGTATNKGQVSQRALVEADAVVEEEEEEEPVGVLGWIKRGVIAAVVLTVVVAGATALMRGRTAKQEKDAIEHTLALLEDKSTGALTPGITAEIYRAAGEFYLHKNKPKEALGYFRKARSQFPRLPASAKVSVDNDMFLARLALSLIELGGTSEEVKNEVRLDWKDLQGELVKTLEGIRSPEGRVAALRALSGKLLKKGQPTIAMGLVAPLSRTEAGKKAQDPRLQAQSVALLYQNQEDMAAKEVPPPRPGTPIADLVARLGYAEGKARKGSLKDAMDIVQAAGPPRDRLEAALAVGDIALEEGAQSEASACANLAFNYLKELKDVIPPWVRLQMVRIVARVDSAQKAKELVKRLPADFKSWAEWEIVQAQLLNNSSVAESILVEEVADTDSLPRALAWEAVARHNTPLDRGDVLHMLQVATDARVRAFLHAGMALGSQDR